MRFPLVGVRLALRPFELSDVDAAHRIYGDARVMRWVGDGAVRGPEHTRATLAEYIDHQRARGFSFWAVLERRSGELIGDAGLYSRGGEVELGYTLAYEQWGNGYATEAAELCVQAAFTELGLPELVALIRPENRSSAAVAMKLGFEPGARVSAYGSDHVLYRLTAPAARAAEPSSGASGRRSPDG